MRDMWERVKAFDGPKIEQKFRVCGICKKKFLSGYLRIERSHSIGAICEKCYDSHRRPDLADLKI
jgi:hypothetical protein